MILRYLQLITYTLVRSKTLVLYRCSFKLSKVALQSPNFKKRLDVVKVDV